MRGEGPWGTGPYVLVKGYSTPTKRSDIVVLEANPNYWDKSRFPRIRRIVFDNTLSQKDALELVKTTEGRVDVVTELSPLETLRVAESSFATVVKNRKTLATVFGRFNMRKPSSPWADIRLRQAVNLAINRPDLIRYGANGNGVIVPALASAHAYGYDRDLAPYAFDPTRARQLVTEATAARGLSINLIAPEELGVQATVVSKMLEQVGFGVELQVLDPAALGQKTRLTGSDQPPEKQTWDIALMTWSDAMNFPVFEMYQTFALEGRHVWIKPEPELGRLYGQVLRMVDRDRQQELIRQMERHTAEQAYFLFLYNPVALHAVNRAVEFVPQVNGLVVLTETALTDRHWSVRKGGVKK